MLSEISQRDIALMWNFRNETNEPRGRKSGRGQPRNGLNLREQTDGYQMGGGVGSV